MTFDLFVKAPESSEYVAPAWHVRVKGQSENEILNMEMRTTDVSSELQKRASELIGTCCGAESLELSVAVPKLVLATKATEAATSQSMVLLVRAPEAFEITAQKKVAPEPNSTGGGDDDGFLVPAAKGKAGTGLKHMRLTTGSKPSVK